MARSGLTQGRVGRPLISANRVDVYPEVAIKPHAVGSERRESEAVGESNAGAVTERQPELARRRPELRGVLGVVGSERLDEESERFDVGTEIADVDGVGGPTLADLGPVDG